MRTHLTLVLLALASFVAPAARSAGARPLELPVFRAGLPPPAPYYLGDVLEIRLREPAARVAVPRGSAPTRAVRTNRTGVARVDALAAALGGATFEPEFPGEVVPESGPDFTAFHLVRLPGGAWLEDALERFRALPEVLSADPIAVMPVQAVPNDSLFFRSNWFTQPGPVRHDIRAPEAWDITVGDTSIVIAILDTGVLPYHPDLGGAVAGGRGNLFTNAAEAGGLAGVDDDGNGYVDDVGGWDFVNLASGAGVRIGEDWRDEDNDPNDYAGHGTAVAGLAGAITNNTIGVAGMAWRTRLLPLRIGWSTTLSPLGEVNMAAVAAAFRYATRMGAQVANCSFQTVNQAGLDVAVSAATRAGMVIVAAAGNNNTPNFYLQAREDAIAVAATNKDDCVPSFSNRGTYVDLAAPGTDILSTFVLHVSADSIGQRQPTYSMLASVALNGTSFSSPLVAGTVALLQADRRARGLDPLTAQGAALRLRETADDITAALADPDLCNRPGLTGYGAGRLNAFRALTDRLMSTATRVGARTVGPPVRWRDNLGRARIGWVTTEGQWLVLDGATSDTLTFATLPERVVGSLAMADLGDGRGPGLFIGTGRGTVLGFGLDGAMRPGFPALAAGGAASMAAGVALGDLDGDGVGEIVGASPDGRLWAFRADGSRVPGFPFASGALGATAPALADIDGAPGAEILFGTGDGAVHAIGFDGQERPNWPYLAPTATRAPVVAPLGVAASPSIIVAAGNALIALAPDASERWNVALVSPVTQDLALLDANDDGIDEIAFATGASVELRDSTGSPANLPGFPITLATSALGPLIAGPWAAGAPRALGMFTSSGLLAWDSVGQAVRAFPKNVGAGAFPALADLDGDGATEVAAGAGPDSLVYIFDAGPNSWADAPRTWPTHRGNEARTGSREGGGKPIVDVVRPAPVADLSAEARGTRSARLRWTASGDDSVSGRARVVRLRRASAPITATNFALATPVAAAPPSIAGAADSAEATALVEGSTHWFALVTEDDAGFVSSLSNVANVTLPRIAPATVTDLRVITVDDTMVTLAWTAAGDDGRAGRALAIMIVGAPGPLDSANQSVAPLRMTRSAAVDGGGTETETVHVNARGRIWRFATLAMDSVGSESALSNVASVLVPVGGRLRGRAGVALAARTSPSRTPVTLDWQGAWEAVGSAQRITLHDVTGRLVRTFAVGGEPGGSLQWDGRDGDGHRVPAGLYFARLASGSFRASARLVLLP